MLDQQLAQPVQEFFFSFFLFHSSSLGVRVFGDLSEEIGLGGGGGGVIGKGNGEERGGEELSLPGQGIGPENISDSDFKKPLQFLGWGTFPLGREVNIHTLVPPLSSPLPFPINPGGAFPRWWWRIWKSLSIREERKL